MEFQINFNEAKGSYELLSDGIPMLEDGNKIFNCVDFTIEASDLNAFNSLISAQKSVVPDCINLFCFPLGHRIDGFTVASIKSKERSIEVSYTTLETIEQEGEHQSDFIFSIATMMKGVRGSIRSIKGINIDAINEAEETMELTVTIPIRDANEPISKSIKKANTKLKLFLMRVNLYLAARIMFTSLTNIAKRTIVPPALREIQS